MQTRAKTVTEYIKEAPAKHLDALTELRELCMQNLKGFREVMEYGYPGYAKDGHTEVSWESDKNGISLYIEDDSILKNFRTTNRALDISRNTIHFNNAESIPFDIVSKILAEVAHSKQKPFI